MKVCTNGDQGYHPVWIKIEASDTLEDVENDESVDGSQS
jgi:hypothetical protein